MLSVLVDDTEGAALSVVVNVTEDAVSSVIVGGIEDAVSSVIMSGIEDAVPSAGRRSPCGVYIFFTKRINCLTAPESG